MFIDGKDPTKTGRRVSPWQVGVAGGGVLAFALAACSSANGAHTSGNTLPPTGENTTTQATTTETLPLPTPSATTAAAGATALYFNKTYTEIVQTPMGARTFNGFNSVNEGSRVPQGTRVQVGCVAQDTHNEMSSVAQGDYYVFAEPPVSGAHNISPSNSYDNTTDPAVLAEPLSKQPIVDPAVPFCTPTQMAALGLA